MRHDLKLAAIQRILDINIPQQLPIVRRCHFPPAGAALRWQEKGDVAAALVVLLISSVGAVLGVAGLYEAAKQASIDLPLVLAALVITLPCAYAIIAALAELGREQSISIDSESVQVGQQTHALVDYRGLLISDRTRRFFIRNQVKPLTGRRGPVTEFVIVLRHREDRSKDLELFRAQPSLEALITMHAMQSAASGRASGANASACAELAATYRSALRRLCAQLQMPALIVDANAVINEWQVEQLDDWLHPLA